MSVRKSSGRQASLDPHGPREELGPGPPPGLSVYMEHDLPAGVLVKVALLGETMPAEPV